MKTLRAFLRWAALFAMVLLIVAPVFVEAQGEVSWELSKDGVLTISGTGNMNGAPWKTDPEKIKKVVVCEGITSVGMSAFSGCGSLEEVVLPESLKLIDDFAFAACNSLKSIYIPAGVEQIKVNAFQSAANLEQIFVSADNAFYASDRFGVLFTKDMTMLLLAPAGFSGTYRIPEGVVSVGGTYDYKIYRSDGFGYDLAKETYYAFDQCTKLTHIEIPEGIQFINEHAFRACNGLTEVTIPNSVTELGVGAFQNCNSLVSIFFGEGVAYIGRYCFAELEMLQEITIPGTVRHIDEYAFGYNPNLKKLVLEDGVAKLGMGAFISCPKLVEVHLPRTLRTIPKYLFQNCEKLTSITIPVEVRIIEDYAFDNINDMKTVTFEGNAPRFDANAFEDRKITFAYPEGNHTWDSLVGTNAGTRANIQWDSYQQEVVPQAPVYLAYWDRTENVDNGTFMEWEFWSDGRLYIRTNASIGDGVLTPFPQCLYEIKKVYIAEGAKGVSMNAFANASSLEEVVFPESMQSIGYEAFLNCVNLKSVSIPAKVGSIMWNSFDGCSNLERIDVAPDNQNYYSDSYGVVYTKDKTMLLIAPQGLAGSYRILEGTTSLGGVYDYPYTNDFGDTYTYRGTYYGLRSCAKMTEVQIPDSVVSIGTQAFWNCDGLKAVQIPDTVTELGQMAFTSCEAMEQIQIGAGITFIQDEAFTNCSALTEIFIPGTVEIIGNNAFSNCFALEKVVMGDGITSVRWLAFFNCPNLKEVHLSSTLTVISDELFNSCSSLESITIPASVTVVGESAFTDCMNLTTVTFQGDAPIFYSSAFPIKALEIRYPENGEGWENTVATNGGLPGEITWTPYEKAGESEHVWQDATCEAPMTCVICGAVEGEALGHSWVEATCEAAKTCSVCGAAEGEALGHSWVDATCEAPKTCSVCAATEGSALKHQYENGSCKHCGKPEDTGLLGDVDGNGKLSYNDALIILRASIKLHTLTEAQSALADFDGNGKLDYNDALKVLRASIGLK